MRQDVTVRVLGPFDTKGKGAKAIAVCEPEALSALIADIYDAALDPSLWLGLLGKVARFVGGHSASLIAKDATSKNGNMYYDDGVIDRRYVQLYFERYVKLDPFNTAHFFAEICRPMSTIDFMPVEEFRETRMWKEWAKPQGLVDFVSVALDKSATSVAMLGVFRHESHGIVDEETKARMQLIAPHVRRAVLIGRAIDLRATEAAAFADAFDGIAAGSFLVDASARVVHANAAGHAMLAAEEVLRAPNGRLAAADTEADHALREIFAAAKFGDTVVGVRGVAVPLISRGGERFVAHVLPLTSGSRRKAGDSLRRGGRTVRAARRARHTGRAGGHRQDLSADADRVAGAARDRRGRRRARGGRGPRHRRGDGEIPPETPVRQDRRQATGRPGQAGGGLCQPAHLIGGVSCRT